jgi:type VI secretion system protein ImpB
MAESFQNEIPKARINITLDLETAGARKKKELPLKLLMLGDFTHGKTTGPIDQRERINIDKVNFEKVLRDLAPEINCVVPNRIHNDGSDLRVNLKVASMEDFRPESIARQLPELRNFVAMRNLLKDFRSNLVDNKRFRLELERILKNQTERDGLWRELRHIPVLDQALPTEKAQDDQGGVA